ncbi:MAG: ORF6N domain-containing protein [Candidatus Binataceae bacterium]
MPEPKSVIAIERIASRIYLIRSERVMLDQDLADLYQVDTRVLVQAIKRNRERFPDDFAFQLSQPEFKGLRSQTVISSWGGRRYPPYALTEQGVAMLSSVLRSQKAARVNVAIMRTFVKLRQILASDRELARKVQEHDRQITILFDTVEKLLTPPDPPKKNPIGYIRPRGG